MKIYVYFLKSVFAFLIVYIEVVLSKDVTGGAESARQGSALTSEGTEPHVIERRSNAFKRLPAWSVYYGKRSGDLGLDKIIPESNKALIGNDVISSNFLPEEGPVSNRLDEKPIEPLLAALKGDGTESTSEDHALLTELDSWHEALGEGPIGASSADDFSVDSGQEEDGVNGTPDKRFSTWDVNYGKRRQGWYATYGKRAPQWLATYGKRAPQWLATYGKRAPQWLATYGKRAPQWLATYGKRAPQWLATYGKRAPQWLATYGKRAPQWLATYGKRAPQWLATYGKRAARWLTTYGKRLPAWHVTYGKRSMDEAQDEQLMQGANRIPQANFNARIFQEPADQTEMQE